VTQYDTNPAGRLHMFFEPLFKMDQGSSCADAVAEVLGMTWPDDWPKVLAAGAALSEAQVEAKSRLAALDSPVAAVAMKNIDEAGVALSHFPLLGTGNQLQWFLSGLSPVGLNTLDTASALLSQIQPDPFLDEADVESLKAQVHDLRDKVAAAQGLDDDARRWIASRLHDIEDALRGIKVTGYAGVERAVNETIGGLRRHPTMLDRLRQSALIRDIVTLLAALDLTLNMAGNVKAIEGGAAPGPSPVVVEIERLTSVEVHQVEVGGKTYTFDGLPALTSGPSDAATPDASATSEHPG
jgi:hypothetical protein